MTHMWASLRRRPSVVWAFGILLAVALVWGVTAAHADQTRTLDQRTYDVASQIQCPVCNGESVADSGSGLAMQMRGVIREQLAAGQSEQQVISYFRERYGDTILESPPKQGFSSLIWVMPLVMLLAGLWIVVTLGREWQASRASASQAERGASHLSATVPADDDAMDAVDLSEDEKRLLGALLRRELAVDEGLPGQLGREGV